MHLVCQYFIRLDICVWFVYPFMLMIYCDSKSIKITAKKFGLRPSVMTALQKIAPTHVPFRLTPP